MTVETVGVVDSSRRRVVEAELSHAGYRTLTYTSVAAALSNVRVMGTLDALVVVERPGLCGVDLIRGLRARRRRGRRPPVILVTPRELQMSEGARFAIVVHDERALLPAVHWVIRAGAQVSQTQLRTATDRVRVRLETQAADRPLLRYILEM